MKKIGIIMIPVLLLSLTACSSTELSEYTYSDYISDTKGDVPKYTVQPASAKTTTSLTEITTVPDSIPETSGTEQQVSEPTSTEPQETTVPAETTVPTSEISPAESIDVDLTSMSSVMVYSEVYNMLGSPESYIGKTIKMKGQYTSYENPDTGRVYHACIVKDATACCAQGLEFTLAENHSEYPSDGDEVTVIGTFSVYQEGYFLFGELADSRFV